ncbi:MAG TPA: hypothetical protein VM282_13040 [Acidimicrobiales bacterium]|nr:hypothetical protein [Acidimicrobiales bacterium]
MAPDARGEVGDDHGAERGHDQAPVQALELPDSAKNVIATATPKVLARRRLITLTPVAVACRGGGTCSSAAVENGVNTHPDPMPMSVELMITAMVDEVSPMLSHTTT